MLKAPLQNDAAKLGFVEHTEEEKEGATKLGFVEHTEEGKNEGAVNKECTKEDIDNDATLTTQATQADKDEDDGDEEEDKTTGKKKRKKRPNKRALAKLKEVRKDFMDRCVSPSYRRIGNYRHNAELSLKNVCKMKSPSEQDD